MMIELTREQMMETDGGSLRDWLEGIGGGLVFLGGVVAGILIGQAVNQAV